MPVFQIKNARKSSFADLQTPRQSNKLLIKQHMLIFKQTSVNPDNGEVLLARPAPEDGGHTMEIYCSALKKYVTIDNSWIVPYNPAMLLKYQGHMNIEKVLNSTFVFHKQQFKNK